MTMTLPPPRSDFNETLPPAAHDEDRAAHMGPPVSRTRGWMARLRRGKHARPSKTAVHPTVDLDFVVPEWDDLPAYLEHEADEHLEHTGRAKKAYVAGAIGSTVLAAVEYRTGIAREALGLVANSLHNLGDGMVHGLRAAVVMAYEACRKVQGKRWQRWGAAIMGATTALSLFHTGEDVLRTAQNPDDLDSLDTIALGTGVGLSLFGNAAIAYLLEWGTKGTHQHEDTVSHGDRDNAETLLNAVSNVHPVLRVASGVFVTKWGAAIAQRMWSRPVEELVGDDHHHQHHQAGPAHMKKKVHRFDARQTLQRLEHLPWKRVNLALGAVVLAATTMTMKTHEPAREGPAESLAATMAGSALAAIENIEHKPPLSETTISIPAIPTPTVELPPYDSRTGAGTLWHIARQQGEAVLGYPPSRKQVQILNALLFREK